jgi:hypothetical protein
MIWGAFCTFSGGVWIHRVVVDIDILNGEPSYEVSDFSAMINDSVWPHEHFWPFINLAA